MAVRVATLEAVLQANTRDFNRDMGRAESVMGKTARGIGTAAKVVAGGGLLAMAGAAKVGWDEFSEGQRVAAQTNAVLKSTGGVANVTAGQVVALSTALMQKSGMDDEAIQSGANLLLTFKDIRNEAGRGNDIFNQATKIMTDMSVALGQDTKSSAIQLGKALNDPIRGMTALRRVGVSFTQAQEDQVEKLVESGRTMEAQKLILRELQSEFGGSAKAAGKTLPGQLDILRQTFSNLAGEVLGRVIPPLVKLGNFILPYVQDAFTWVEETAARFGYALEEAGDTVGGFGPMVRRVLGGVADFIREYLLPVVMRIWDVFRTAFQRVMAVLRDNREEIRRIFERVGAVIRNHAAVVVPILRFIFVEVVPRAVDITIKALDKILPVYEKVSGWIRDLRDKIAEHIDSFVGFFKDAPGRIRDVFRDGWLRMMRTVNFLVTSARDFIGNVVDSIVQFFKDMPGRIVDALKGIGGKIKDAFSGLDISVPFTLSGVFGDGVVSPASNPGGLVPQILDELALAQAHGLVLTSGYRPGSITSTGNPSLHGVGRAIDVAGSAAAMAAYARAVAGRPGIREVLYTPVGGWYPGVGWTGLSGTVASDHYDHVHVGVADKGAWIPPRSTALLTNNTGMWEPVGPPGRGTGDTHFHFPHYVGSHDELARAMRRAMRDHAARNGTGGF